MRARTEDATWGWNLYRESGYELSLTEINLALENSGRRRVSARMYAHYGKLHRYGYYSYVPINRLDVKTLQDPFWDQAAGSRLAPRIADIETELALLRGAGPIISSGRVTQVTDTSAVFRPRTKKREVLDVGAPGELAILTFVESGVERPVQILAIEADSNMVTVGFASYLELSRVTDARPAPGSELTITATPPSDDVYLVDTVRSLYWVLVGMEASRSTIEWAFRGAGPAAAHYLEPTTVRSLTLGSPLELAIYGPQLASALFKSAVGFALRVRNVYRQKPLTDQIVAKLSLENDRNALLAKLDGPQAALDVLDKAASTLSGWGIDLESEDLDPAREMVQEIIEKQVIPAAHALVSAFDGQLVIEADEQLPELEMGLFGDFSPEADEE